MSMSPDGLMNSGGVSVTVINTHRTVRVPHEPLRLAAERVFSGEKISTATVNVVLVDDEELLRINREFLNHDYYTDVITFPLEEAPLEGEIYVSVDRAREQAAEYGVRLRDELRRLVAHGALHLAGYDDATAEERRRMRMLEDRYLELG